MKSDRDFNSENNLDFDSDIRFVAERYRKDRFSVDQGWKRLSIGHSLKWIRMRSVAAVAAVIVLSASAAFLYRAYYLHPQSQTQETIHPAVAPTAVVKVIDFEDAPLDEVVARIEEVYGIEIQNLPDNSDRYTLSMHYEGNVENLLKEINDILDTQLTIKQ